MRNINLFHKELLMTSDGSTTLYFPDLEEHYHSKHGAIQEASHVYINTGLVPLQNKKSVSILEIGFGTGLNCMLTYLESIKYNLNINYHGVEAFPISDEEFSKMNYLDQLSNADTLDILNSIHTSDWDTPVEISKKFNLTKRKQLFEHIANINEFDLIYFDAFGPRVQPELWVEDILIKMHTALKSGGIFVTYCAKGSVRRLLSKIGFTVERLPGPPGKREMLRAVK